MTPFSPSVSVYLDSVPVHLHLALHRRRHRHRSCVRKCILHTHPISLLQALRSGVLLHHPAGCFGIQMGGRGPSDANTNTYATGRTELNQKPDRTRPKKFSRCSRHFACVFCTHSRISIKNKSQKRCQGPGILHPVYAGLSNVRVCARCTLKTMHNNNKYLL